MRRTIRSGSVIERSQFFVGERKPRRDRRKGNSTMAKKDANMKTAVRCLARVLNCNFHKGDLLITLTYDDEHLGKCAETPEQAEQTVWKFIRRLSYALGKLGADLKTVWITADKDEKSGRYVRLHHHLVVSGENFTIERQDGVITNVLVGKKPLRKMWGNGFVNVEPLAEQPDYTPIANYFVRQAVNGTDTKKWHSTRNMEKPIIESEIVTVSPSELRAPGGATVLEVGPYDIENGSHYIRYIRKARNEKTEESGPAGMLPVREERQRGPAG